MELRVFNKELEPLGIVDEYGTLIDSRFINKTETIEKYCE